MLTPNHPNDERLSALAAGDDDARADAALASHVDACAGCAEVVAELGALRASLADLPDVAPSRPLRLLPPVERAGAPTADRVGGWARRLFAPVLTAGAALAMVGLVGTAMPAMQEMSGTGDAAAPPQPAEEREAEADGLAGTDGEGHLFSATDAPAAGEDAPEGGVAADQPDEDAADADDVHAQRDDAGQVEVEGLPAERSPWPMLLFTGVALIIGALLLRWILVPRAG